MTILHGNPFWHPATEYPTTDGSKFVIMRSTYESDRFPDWADTLTFEEGSWNMFGFTMDDVDIVAWADIPPLEGELSA